MPMTQWQYVDELPAERTPLLKILIWVYFVLLIFEGAIRKWLLPQFSMELLLVRDPVALAILWEAYRTRKWPREWSATVGTLTLSLVFLFTVQTIVLAFPWYIALFGLRSYLLPLPVAFVIGANLDREDLKKFGRCTLWLTLPLTALEIVQYYAPADSFWNAGAYSGASQIGYVGEHVRASATFSFVSGPIHFTALAAGFIMYGLIDRDFIRPRALVWLSASALLISIPVTGARTTVYEMGVLIVLALIAALWGISEMMGSLKSLAVLLLVAALVSQLPIFSDSMETLSRRFSEASSSEGDTRTVMRARAVAPITQSLDQALTTSNWLGQGMGYGSNLAARVMVGQNMFLAGESEWERVITEFGPFFGIAFMVFRVLLALLLISRSMSRIREHQPLAWFLIVATIPGLVFEILEQPTIQGFLVITIGFMLAALNRDNFEPEPLVEDALPLHQRRFRAGAQ